jgi:hypothetical protein
MQNPLGAIPAKPIFEVHHRLYGHTGSNTTARIRNTTVYHFITSTVRLRLPFGCYRERGLILGKRTMKKF